MNLNGYINAISSAIERGAMEGCKRGAFLVEREAKKNAPVDTSRYKNSIYTNVDMGRHEAYTSPRVYYAAYLEWGTGKYNILGVRRSNGWIYTVHDKRSKWFGTHYTEGMVAKKTMSNSYNAQKANIEKIIVSEINKELSKL